MSKQIINYNIKKSEKKLAEAIQHLILAAQAVSEIDPEYKPERLAHADDFLLNIASGFMEVYDNYATELLYPH